MKTYKGMQATISISPTQILLVDIAFAKPLTLEELGGALPKVQFQLSGTTPQGNFEWKEVKAKET